MFKKFIINHKFKSFFLEKKIHDSKMNLPIIRKIKFYSWGYRIYIDVSKKCEFSDIENNLNYLISSLRVFDIEVIEKYICFIVLDVIENGCTHKKFKNIQLDPYKLLIGFNSKGEEELIDMKVTPHLAIQGLSNMGKTVLSEYIANNLIYNSADVILINTYFHDFESLDLTRINDFKEIEIYLEFLLKSKLFFETPLYLIIDEVNILARNKNIDKLIENLLEVARHNNIYLICIGQMLLKENIKYKQLFNSRITFKQIDKILYTSFLNVKQELLGELDNQEFYAFDENLKRCFCYEYLP